jgi:hypothetical protein
MADAKINAINRLELCRALLADPETPVFANIY